MKGAMYSSIPGFVGIEGVFYATNEQIAKARKILSEGNGYEQVGIDGHYHISECTIIDLRGLGLRILYEEDEQLKSIVSKLFEDNVSRA